MSSPTNFGASIVPTPLHTTASKPSSTLDSPALTPVVSSEDLQQSYTNKPVPPHSPFYQHPPASFEKIHSRQESRTNAANTNEKDLEAATTIVSLAPPTSDESHPFAGKVSVDRSRECRMWPSKQTLMQEQEERRRAKRDQRTLGNVTGPVVDFWHRFSKRQKLGIQIAGALLLVGVCVAIAVGITVAVNGTVYVGEDKSKEIPDPSKR